MKIYPKIRIWLWCFWFGWDFGSRSTRYLEQKSNIKAGGLQNSDVGQRERGWVFIVGPVRINSGRSLRVAVVVRWLLLLVRVKTGLRPLFVWNWLVRLFLTGCSCCCVGLRSVSAIVGRWYCTFFFFFFLWLKCCAVLYVVVCFAVLLCCTLLFGKDRGV